MCKSKSGEGSAKEIELRWRMTTNQKPDTVHNRVRTLDSYWHAFYIELMICEVSQRPFNIILCHTFYVHEMRTFKESATPHQDVGHNVAEDGMIYS